MPSIIIYKSRRKAIKLILLGSVFVVPTIWLLSIGKMSGFMPWLTIGFFGLAYPLGLFQLFDRRPQIIIDEIGIFDRMLGKWAKQVAAFSEAIGAQELNISLANVRVDVVKLTTFLTIMLHADLSRRSDLIVRRLKENSLGH